VTTIDIASRFPRMSLREAYERSKRSEQWVFHETLCSSVTLLYGRSNVGKSYLVASMLLSLLIEEREFLGMQPTDTTKIWKPAILWTDPGSDEEYGRRIYQHLPEGVEIDIPMFHVGRTTRPDEWGALAGSLLSEGCNFVVVDNLMGVTGDSNDAGTVTTVFDGLTRLTNRGVPVVVIHHESEHGGSNPGAPPMGASVIVQKSRTWIQVRQTAKRKLRGGNAGLVIQSNALQQPLQVIAEPLTGPAYQVLERGPWVPRDENCKPKRTLDQNAQIAQWVVANCQGIGVNEVAKLVAEQFGGTEGSRKTALKQEGLSKLLKRAGVGGATAWSPAN
jgi:hypothetical protein